MNQSTNSTASREGRPSPSRSKVLLIDDSPDICAAVKELLELEGLSVVTRSSGAAGLNEMKKAQYGLVLLDVNLSDMNAREILNELQADQLLDRQPIVAFTASPELIGKDYPGLSGIIRKPIDIVELTQKIKGYLTLH
ncbi:MAG TPA: response regulator [Bdellovibrionales bacterium]|nr:response regulator [Bdellovibrionales bacterium]